MASPLPFYSHSASRKKQNRLNRSKENLPHSLLAEAEADDRLGPALKARLRSLLGIAD
jgi:hypothetical protein